MTISRGFIAGVKYLADNEWHIKDVLFDALPRHGERVTFHGDGMEYDYAVQKVVWHLTPGVDKALPGKSIPIVVIGPCIERREIKSD